MTVRELITSALRLIRQLGPGRTAGASELADAVFVANAMLEAWSVNRLLIARIEKVLTTLTGAPSYPIAPAVRVEAAWLVNGSSRSELEVLTRDRWLRSLAGVYHEAPATVYVEPAQASGELELSVWQRLSALPELDEEIAFPEGYADAIRYNLAVRLAPEWGRALRADVLALAQSSLAALEALHAPVIEMGCDRALLEPRFDVWTGDR